MKEFSIEIEGVRRIIRYNDLPGNKTPIVFIPGWGCASSFDFVECASQKGLNDHRRILIDLLGAGYSDRDDNFDYLPGSHAKYILEIIDFLELDNFIIYAHSMGGRIALALANLLGARVKGLILAEGSMVQEYFPYMQDGEDKFVNEYYHKMLRSLSRKDDQQFLGTVRNADPKALYREAIEMMSPESYKWEELFFNADYKKVFIVGENTDDDGFNLDNIKNQDDIHLITIKNAGHTMNWDLPFETSQAIIDGISFIE